MTKLRRIFIFLFVIVINLFTTITTKAQPLLSEGEAEFLRTLISMLPDGDKKLESIEKLSQSVRNLDTMLIFTNHELEIATALKDTAYIMKAQDRMGWCNAMLGHHEESLDFYRKNLELSRITGNELESAKAVAGIGDALLGMKDFEKAIELKKMALIVFREHGQKAEMGMIYRTLGKACLDYMQYGMALDYFENALEIDLKLPPTSDNLRNVGRDYHFLSQSILVDVKHREQKVLEKAKDMMMTALRYNQENDDHIYLIHSCVNLSLMYAGLVMDTNNWNYADSSLYYYNLGKETINSISYNRYLQNYEIAHAIHLTLIGYKNEALEILNRLKNSNIQDHNVIMNLGRGFNFYYHFNNDWKGVLENRKREELNRKQIYISEFLRKVSRIDAETEFVGQLYSIDYKSRVRNEEFNRVMGIHKRITGYATIAAFLIITVIIVMLAMYYINRETELRLQRQEDDLLKANSKLQNLIDETQEQSLEIAAQTKELKRQRNKMSTYNFKMMVHLGIGQRMQLSILPSMDTVRSIWKDAFVMWRPLEEVSGDFYWCTECKGQRVMAVADCTGHGIPGAFLSMLGVALLNSIVPRMGDNITASAILDQLRERIEEHMRRGATHKNDIHDGMDMAICVHDANAHRIQYAGAYRPMWMVREGKLTEYKGNKMPVAVDEDRKGNFSNHVIDTQKGDMIYMFSDGITDQFGLINGKLTKYKAKRLREFVEKAYILDTYQQKNELESAIEQWSHMQEQTDDILVVGIKEQ